MGMVTDGRRKAVFAITSRIGEFEPRIEGAERFDRHIGHVLASSGYRLSQTDCNLDWALIALNPSKIGKNMVRARSNFATSIQKAVQPDTPGADPSNRALLERTYAGPWNDR
jgi:hypothetical protein